MWGPEGLILRWPGGQISFYATRGTAEVGAFNVYSMNPSCIDKIFSGAFLRFSQMYLSDYKSVSFNATRGTAKAAANMLRTLMCISMNPSCVDKTF